MRTWLQLSLEMLNLTASLARHVGGLLRSQVVWMADCCQVTVHHTNTDKYMLEWHITRRKCYGAYPHSYKVSYLPQHSESVPITWHHPQPFETYTVGIYVDSNFSMQSQVSRTVSHCLDILRQLRTIRRSGSQSGFQSLVADLVLTKLDIGNAMLAGNPSFQLDHECSGSTCRYDHITPLLCRLHWLHVPQRISFKLAVTVYQCVRGLGPAYLADALQPVARISWSTMPAVIVNLGIGCPVYMTVHYQRPSVSGSCGTNMEEFASQWCHQIPCKPSNKLKSHLFLASFP